MDYLEVPFSDIRSQNSFVETELTAAVQRVMDECSFIGGSDNAEFEAAFAAYHDTKHCVGVGNGTDALEIALQSLDLPRGSEVIVPANSFIATAEAVSRTGLTVRFADVDASYTLDIDSVRSALNEHTSAIIPVHLYGQPADMGSILDLSREFGLRVIEDCAQAHGAEFMEQKVGSFGEAGAFSFYPGKNLGAFGDAGAIVTSDEAIESLCRKISNHGRLTKFAHELEGRNSRLDSLQAAVLAVKLRMLPIWTARRRQIASTYDCGLADVVGLVRPWVAPDRMHVYHHYVVRTDRRDFLRAELAKVGIATGIHYPVPLPQLEPYAKQHFDASIDMNSVVWAPQLLSLPIHESLSDDQVEFVVHQICMALAD